MVTIAAERHSNIWWVFLLQGIAAIIFGILLLTDPAATLVALVIFLGFYWLFLGALELVRVFVDRSVPWYWSALLGILGILAGILVLRHPLFAAVLLPATLVIWLGVLGLVIGVIEIIGAFSGGGVGSFILGVINILIGLLILGSPGDACRADRLRHPVAHRRRRADRLGLPHPRLTAYCRGDATIALPDAPPVG